MTSSNRFHVLMRAAILAGLAGCQVHNAEQVMVSKKSAVELRAMQARAFETSDQNRILRAVIATLQDLGYSLDKVDASSGTVSATKLAALKLSASAYPHGPKQTVVRANALLRLEGMAYQVDAPEFYQKNFFEPLSAAMFLSAISAPGESEAQAPALQPAQAVAPAAVPSAGLPVAPRADLTVEETKQGAQLRPPSRNVAAGRLSVCGGSRHVGVPGRRGCDAAYLWVRFNDKSGSE